MRINKEESGFLHELVKYLEEISIEQKVRYEDRLVELKAKHPDIDFDAIEKRLKY